MVFFDGGVVGGEEFVAVEDGVGTGEEAKGLCFVGEAGAASGEADFCFGDGDAGDGDHADEVEGIDLWIFGEGCAGHGHEGVDGDGFRLGIEVGDDFEEAEAVGDGFAEAEDTAAAHGHASVLDVFDGAEAVFVGVCGDDVGVVLGGGVEVVVVGGDAGIAELYGFIGAEFAEGYADFHAEFRDVADDVEDLIEALCAAADTTPSSAHAEAGGAGSGGGLCAFEDVAFSHEAFGFDAGFVAGGLCAVGAVFGAPAGFDGEEGAELDFGLGPVLLVDFTGFLDEIEEGEGVEVLEFREGHRAESLELRAES